MIKKLIKKYSTYIIMILLILLLLKSCNSCSAERQNTYNIEQLKTKYNTKIDSLYNVILCKEYEFDSVMNINTVLKDSLNNNIYENNMLKTIILEVKHDKEYYRTQNKSLVNMANNLSKKDTIK